MRNRHTKQRKYIADKIVVAHFRKCGLAAAGFTLIELITVLAVAGILLGVAVPNMRLFILNSRLTTYTNELIADLNLARSEATKRGQRIVVCKSADPRAATPACTTAGTWATGRIIFVDAPVGTPPVYNNAYNTADGDTLLRLRDPLDSPDNTLTATQMPTVAAVNFISYTKLGTTTIALSQQAIFRICDERLTAKGKRVSVDTMGRANLGAADAC